MTIKDFLPEDYLPEENHIIYFTLGEVNNPTSTYQVKGLKITIYAEGKYAIDEFEGQIPWELVTGTFNKMNVASESTVAYRAENLYTITFNPQHKIPQNGYVEVLFPAEVTVPDYSFSQSSCAATAGFPSSQITCEFTPPTSESDSYYSFKILNAFRRTEGQANVDYVFTLPGIRNPIQTIPTANFIFQTFTRDA